MPRYDCFGGECGEDFELDMTVSERETAELKCPACGSKVVSQRFQRVSLGAGTGGGGGGSPGGGRGACGGGPCCG